MATYNSEKTVARAIKSLDSQTFKGFEVIFVDKNSSDGTEKILKKSKLNKFIIRGEDRGIYDAMNKGISHSSGKFVYILNSDDELYDKKVFENMVPFLRQDYNFVYGATVVPSSGKLVSESYDFNVSLLSRGLFPAQQCIFYKRNLFSSVGLFDISYKSAADFEFLCRVIASNPKIKRLDLRVCIFHPGGFSGNNIGFFELQKIIRKHFGFFSYFKWKYKIVIKTLLRSLLTKLGLIGSYRKIKKLIFKL